MKLQAKIIEEDVEKRRAILKAFNYYGVSFNLYDDQISIDFSGNKQQTYIFAELIRICEDSRCTSFRIAR